MKVHQFRCWPSAGDNNDYANIKIERMFSGSNILDGSVNEEGTYVNITQIGIQGAPGTRFWFNDAQQSSNPNALKGIVLNWTGIFEIDLSDIGGEINSIIFDPSSKILYEGPETAEGIKPNNYKLIVDVLYDNGGVQ